MRTKFLVGGVLKRVRNRALLAILLKPRHYYIRAKITIFPLYNALTRVPIKALKSLSFFTVLYGPAGIFIYTFGSHEVWQIQTRVLGGLHEAEAMDFKKSIQEESSIIAVAVSVENPETLKAIQSDSIPGHHPCSDRYHCAIPGQPEPNTLDRSRFLHTELAHFDHSGLLCNKTVPYSRALFTCRAREGVDPEPGQGLTYEHL